MRKIPDVFLLAENRLLREALIRLLSKPREVHVVGAAGYSPEVHHQIVTARPQILLLDSHGLEFSHSTLISTLRSAMPELQIVMVDMEPHQDVFLNAVRAGVVGYVVKDASAQEVAATIRAVAAGRAVCPPSLCMVLFRCVMEQRTAPAAPSFDPDFGLTRREQQMVGLLRQRLTNKEIAARLHLSEQTVKNHVHRVLKKIGVHDRLGVLEAFEDKQLHNRNFHVIDGGSSGKAS